MRAYIVECLGTLLFLSVILFSGNPLWIAVALFVVILLGQKISGGHFNPAVSIMFWANGTLTNKDTAAYIVSQILGGLGALYGYKYFL
jgi:glycerol uptake facilitator-like aquaporin